MLGLGNSITSGAALGEFNVANVSGLVTWLKADTGVTETSVGSGLLARWTDQSGSADWVSNQTGKQPDIVGTGVDTYLDFDGNDRLYQKDVSWNTSDDGFDFDFPHDQFDVMNAGGSGGSSTFAVVHLASANTLNTLVEEAHYQDDGVQGSGFTFRTDISGAIKLNPGASEDSMTVGGIDATASAFNLSTDVGDELPLNTKILVALEYEGGSNGEITFRKNGVNFSLTSNNTVTTGVITVGRLGNGMKGRLYELINFSSKVSSSDRANIESYLMDRHSIS